MVVVEVDGEGGSHVTPTLGIQYSMLIIIIWDHGGGDGDKGRAADLIPNHEDRSEGTGQAPSSPGPFSIQSRHMRGCRPCFRPALSPKKDSLGVSPSTRRRQSLSSLPCSKNVSGMGGTPSQSSCSMERLCWDEGMFILASRHCSTRSKSRGRFLMGAIQDTFTRERTDLFVQSVPCDCARPHLHRVW